MQSPRTERGAVAVEGALAAPLVLLLLFAVLDGAMLLGSNLALAHAAQSAARAGSVAASDVQADYDILQAVKSGTPVLGSNALESIVVYRAQRASDAPPAACLAIAQHRGSGGVPGQCNVYTAADLARPISDFGPAGWSGDDAWGSWDRKAQRTAGPDYVGVWVRGDCGCAPELFGADATQTRKSAVRIEARRS